MIHKAVKLRDPSEPEGVHRLAFRRVNALVLWYGHCITSLSIEQLAASCYLQGVEDATTVFLKDERTQEIPKLENQTWENMQ